MITAFRKMQHGGANNMIEHAIWERHGFYSSYLKVFMGDLGVVFPQCGNGCCITVNTIHLETRLYKPVEVAPAARACIQDYIRWGITAFHYLIEQVDVGIADDCIEFFHG